jgi:UrcA family protein
MDTSTSRRQSRLGVALIAATLLPLTVSPALAETSTIGVAAGSLLLDTYRAAEVQQQAVPYGDLDLETAKGLETLNSRIAAAVRNVCMHSDPRQRFSMLTTRQCREDAEDRAMADIQELDGAALFGKK